MDSTGEQMKNARALGDAWFTPGRFVLFLSLVILAKYPRVALGLDTFFYRDYGLFTYPIAHYFRECFWRGDLPLWNPFNQCGVPLLAQWNTSVLYPPSLFYLILPLPWSLAVFNLLHLLFAGLGMYFLALHWTRSRLAGSVAGLAFAFNGISFHMLMWISNLAAYAWMPWVVLLTIKCLKVEVQSPFKVRPVVLAGVAGAMQMLSGAPEIILLTWLVLGVWWFVQFVRGTIPRAQLFWRMAAVCLLVAGLSAAQLLPFLELLKHSQRDAGYGDSRWAMPGWGWANFFVPLFHCTPSIIGVFSQDAQQWTSSYYLGIGTVALALLALCRKQPRVWWLALATVAGVVLAMGDNIPVYGFLRRVFPLIGVMRYPVKIVVLTAFALPLLAGFGLSGQEENTDGNPRKAGRRFVLLGMLLGLVLAGILAYAHRFPVRNEIWAVTFESGLTRATILLLVLGAAWAIQGAESVRTVGLGGAALLLLMTVDALTHTPDQNPTLPNIVYSTLEMPGLEAVRVGESRAAVNPRLQGLLTTASIPDRAAYYLSLRRALFLDSNLINGIPTINGFVSVDIRSFAEVRSLFPRADGIPGPLADFLGVSRISSADTSFTWTDRAHFMPLVTCGQKPIFAAKEETLKALVLPSFNPRATVYLAESARGGISITNQALGRVTMRRFSAQQIECELQADAPVLVVVAQVLYEPWHAYVDGQRVPLWEANGAFQAFAAPAGKHEIRIVYEDTAFKIGAMISLATLLSAGLIWMIGRFPLGRRNV